MADLFASPILAHLKDSSTNQAKDELGKTAKDLSKVPFLKGSMVTATIAGSGSGATKVSHKLGYKPQGWLVLGWTLSAPNFYESAKDKRAVTFTNTSINATSATFWFF